MRSTVLIPIGAATVLLLGACGVPATVPTDAPTTVVSAGQDADPGVEPTVAGATVPAGDPSPVVQPTPSFTAPTADVSTQPPAGGEQPVATRPGAFNKTKVRASVFPVRRVGQTATVNLYFEATDPGATFQLDDQLGDGNFEIASHSAWAVDGVHLTDPTAKTMYLPAVTADGDCVCSPEGIDGLLADVPSSWVTVTFAAPPAGLTAIDVNVPTFGTFTNVPIQ